MTEKQKIQPSSSLKFFLEFGPLLIFLIAYQRGTWLIEHISFFKSFDPKTESIFPATALFMIAMVISLIIYRIKLKHFPIMPLVSTALVLLFGGFSLFFHDANLIKIKVTIFYVIFFLVLYIGTLFDKPLIKYVLEEAFTLPHTIWLTLSKRWAFFFLALAILNEIIWRTFSTDFWAYFKVFGVIPITIIFVISQIPLIMKSQKK